MCMCESNGKDIKNIPFGSEYDYILHQGGQFIESSI